MFHKTSFPPRSRSNPLVFPTSHRCQTKLSNEPVKASRTRLGLSNGAETAPERKPSYVRSHESRTNSHLEACLFARRSDPDSHQGHRWGAAGSMAGVPCGSFAVLNHRWRLTIRRHLCLGSEDRHLVLGRL